MSLFLPTLKNSFKYFHTTPTKPELNIREENIMKICICDDEKDFIHNFQLLLKQYSKKHKNINQFNSFENENDLLSYFYSQNDIDILFLDIKLRMD